MQRMTILGLTMDSVKNMPLLTMKSESTGIAVHVWLGASEALHISMAQAPIQLASPLIHESVLLSLSMFNGILVSCFVSDLREGIFTASVDIEMFNKRASVPCRFADGIALALRAKAPVFIATHVLEQIAAKDSTLAGHAPQYPADMAEHLVAKVLPESMRATLLGKKEASSFSEVVLKQKVATRGKGSSIESLKEKLLREMEPASRLIM